MTVNTRFVRCGTLVALVALALAAPAAAAPGSRPAAVFFLRDGKPVAVSRTVPTIHEAVRSLLAGPTLLEQARGIRSTIPGGTSLLDVTVARRIVTVDLGARFALGRNERELRGRVEQLVRTLRAVPGVQAVRLKLEGGIPVGLFPGYDLRRPVAKPLARETAPPTARAVQQALVDLGFMAEDGVTGTLDEETSVAVLAFQKWSGLPRDGILAAPTEEAILRATRPEPALRRPGKRIELQLGRQLALLIERNRVLRTVHISSGAYGKTPTGSFRVYRKERYSWSVPFKVWLPWASYITGGVAFHEFGSVPTYAASHGCIRVNHYDAAMLYAFAEHGTPVEVFEERA